jgi:hypothetical protein
MTRKWRDTSAAGGESAAVWKKLQGKNRFDVAYERFKKTTYLDVPEANGFVIACGGEGFAVRTGV